MITHPYKNKFAFRLLAWFCPSGLHEGIEGDLLEQFEHDIGEVGEKAARRKLLRNVLRFFRPGIILRNRFSFQLINTIMIGNYFKVASRNIIRRKLYSFINAFGLSIGIAFCILICLFIQDERSFEQYHANKDLIYRMHGVEYNERSGEFHKMTQMQLGLAPAMKAELPEVQYATHFCSSSGVMQYHDKIFREEIVYVDADFFNMFSYHLISGNAGQLFSTIDEIVLTEDLARKYFGDADPLGELVVFGQHTLKVTGVMKTPPANSRLQYQALVPIQKWRSYSQHNLNQWLNMGFETYVQVYAQANVANMKVKLDNLTEKYMGNIFEKWQKDRKLPQGVKAYEIGFTNLADIHFEKGIGDSDPKYSWILGGIAVLILLIACINYVSLALTTSARRRMEVGVRKAAGAHKSQLVYQFSVESVLLAFISMVIGMGLAALFLPAFNTFTGKSISLQSADLPFLMAASLAITVTVGLMAGSYPAFFLSRFRPSEVLKGGFTARLQAGFAKPLVVVQFVFSAFLIISSVVMYRQMQYIGTKDLGYDQHQLVVIPTNAGRGEDTLRIAERFMHQAQQHPSVIAATSTDFPFAGGDMMNYSVKVNGERKSAAGYLVAPDFIRTMGMEIVQGRDFDASNNADGISTVIVNEALVREMKWSDPFQERLRFSRQDTIGSRVIGVVRDFHFLSLKENIGPMFFTIDRRYGRLDYMLVRISPDDIPGTIAQLQKDFTAVAPNKPFEYSFMDDNVARQYERFNRWMSIMGLATGFAVLISCLGLFGLAGINAVNRTKEIGIRKVLGADLGSIFVMLNRQFVWLSVIAFAIAAPLSWYVMNEWLANFSFRIAMGWELFAAGMLIGLVVALLAVSYHGIRAALINPADTLKYE